MTITVENVQKSWPGDDATTSFAATAIRGFATDEFTVNHINTSAAVDALGALVLDTDYSIAIDSDGVGITVTFPLGGSSYSTLATGETLVLTRVTEATQEVVLRDQGAFLLTSVMNMVDRVVAMIQEKARALIFTSSFDSSSFDATVPTPTASYILGANAANDGLAWYNNLSTDAGMAALGALTFAADKGVYWTADDTPATFDLTAAGRALLDDATATAQLTTLGLTANGKSLVTAANYAAMKALLDLEIGTDVQAYDAGIQNLAGVTFAADKGVYWTADNVAAAFDLTAAGRALLDDATAAAQLTTLGLTANGQSLVTAANYAAMKALLDLEIGTDVQAYDAVLTTLAGASANGQSLVTAANYAAMKALLDLEIGTDVQAYDAVLTTLAGASANGQSLVTAADYAAMRGLLGLTARIGDYADLATAITAISSTNTTLIIDSAITTDSVTVPENVELAFTRAGKISVNTAQTLTVNGHVRAGSWQVFDGAGSVAGAIKNPTLLAAWFGVVADGSTDDGGAMANVLSAASEGHNILLPNTGNDIKIATGVDVNKGVHISGGGSSDGVQVLASGAVTCFTLSARGAKLSGFKIYGDRTTNQKGIEVATNGAETIVRDMHLWLLDVGIYQSGNVNHCIYDRLRLRNIKTTVMLMEDGVGPRIHDCFYDTDTGTYAEPTTGGLVINCEGVQASDCDFIHAGRGLVIFPTASRSVEWCLFNNCFFDSSSLSGAHIYNDQATNYIRGLHFNQCWFATSGDHGVLIDGAGAGDIDGIEFNDCPSHNNGQSGFYIDHAKAIVSINNAKVCGNDVDAIGANGIYADKLTRLDINGGYFGRRYRWTADPAYHIYIASNATEVNIQDPQFDGNATSGNLLAANGDATKASMSRWTLWDSGSLTAGSVASVDFAADGMECFSEIKVAIDGLELSSNGDLRISLSDDNGSTFANISHEKLQFNVGSEGRNAYIDGSRMVTAGDAIQATIRLDNHEAFKQVTYQSNLDGSSGQGLMFMGTVEDTALIDLIRLAGSAGNITDYDVKVYVR